MTDESSKFEKLITKEKDKIPMNSAVFVEGEDWLYCGHNNQIIKWELDSGVNK